MALLFIDRPKYSIKQEFDWLKSTLKYPSSIVYEFTYFGLQDFKVIGEDAFNWLSMRKSNFIMDPI